MELGYLMQDEMIPVDKLQLSHTMGTRRPTNQQKTTATSDGCVCQNLPAQQRLVEGERRRITPAASHQ